MIGNRALLCQSQIHSDQVLLDMPHVEDVTFNIKFAYLKIADFTQDF